MEENVPEVTPELVKELLDYVVNRVNLAWVTAVEQTVTDPLLQARVMLVAGMNTLALVEGDMQAIAAAPESGTLDNLTTEQLKALFPEL